jgi:hypothetical protein
MLYLYFADLLTAKNTSNFAVLISPGAEIGRQACLRGMCSLGRAGSSPAPGTMSE